MRVRARVSTPLCSYTTTRYRSLLGVYWRLSGGKDAKAIVLGALASAGVDITTFLRDVLIPDVHEWLVKGFELEHEGAVCARAHSLPARSLVVVLGTLYFVIGDITGIYGDHMEMIIWMCVCGE